MAELSAVLESLAGRVRAHLSREGDGDPGETLAEVAGVLETLAATQDGDRGALRSADSDLWRYRSELAQALGQEYDEDDVPDTWADLLVMVGGKNDRIRELSVTIGEQRDQLDRIRTAATGRTSYDDDDLARRIADRAQLVTTLARSLELNRDGADLPAAVTVAVANLKALVRRQAQENATRTSTGHDQVVRVIKALGTWSPGHEAMDTIDLGDAAVHDGVTWVRDAEAYRASCASLIKDRGQVNDALGLGYHAPLPDVLQAIEQLKASAQDSPDGLADRVAEALGLDTSPDGLADRVAEALGLDTESENGRGGVDPWTDEGLAWLVDQVRETVALHAQRDRLVDAVTVDRDQQAEANERMLTELRAALDRATDAAWPHLVDQVRETVALHAQRDQLVETLTRARPVSGVLDQVAVAVGLTPPCSVVTVLDQVRDLRDQLHRAVVNGGDARSELFDVRQQLDRMTTDRDAERDERTMYLQRLRGLASEQAGGELVVDEGVALIDRVRGIVAALVRAGNESTEREATLRATIARNRMGSPTSQDDRPGRDA